MISFKDFMRKRNDKKWQGHGREELVKYVLSMFKNSKWEKDGWDVSYIHNPKYGKENQKVKVTIIKGQEEKDITI